MALAELVHRQVGLVQQVGVLMVLLGWRRIPIIFCVDACLLWQTSATRADVFVEVWPGGPVAASKSANWATWCVMASTDDRAWLCGMGEAPGLHS